MPILRRLLIAGSLALPLGWLARPRAPRPLPRAGPPFDQPRRVLAIKLADIGDALGIEPALAALRAAWPAATVEALVTPGARAALGGCPHLDGVVDFDKYVFDSPSGLLRPRNLIAAARFLWRLRRRRYQIVVLFHHLSTRWGAAKFALVCRLTGAPVVVGLDNGRGGFLTHAAPDLGFGARPEWRYWLDVVGALGLPAPEASPAFPIAAGDQAAADALLAGLPRAGGPLVAIHAGVGGYAPIKQWPVERFAAVGRRLIETADATVLVVGGPEMTALGAALTGAIGPGAVDLAGRTSLPVLAGLLRRCDLMLGNESGVAHLASAVGCRTLALFGPTNAAAWAPYGTRVLTLPRDGGTATVAAGDRGLALRVDEPCSPCYYAGFAVKARGRCPHRNCLRHLRPEAVAGVALDLLAAR
jgi:ADP-heptose:LPS heptosyltransferase